MKERLTQLKDPLNQSQRLIRVKNWFSDSYQDLGSKGRYYWILAAVLLIVGMLLGDVLGDQSFWVNARYSIYNTLQRASAHPVNSSTRTVIVLIGDEEYWKGELARRTPLKRDYLASLLIKLAQTNPAVIALDVDLGSQTADKSLVSHPDYQSETDKLLTAIKTVSHDRPVVLPRGLFVAGLSHGAHSQPAGDSETYEVEPAIFDGYNFESDKVRYGYVALPYDVRQVPLALPLKDGSELDSFAAAIVRPLDKSALQDAESSDKTSLPYGTFIPPDRIAQIPAKQVMDGDLESLRTLLAANAVIVGGAWHLNSFERGHKVDTHLTPAGEVGGVFVHANYVEALLTHRVTKPAGKVFGVFVEIALAVFIAIVFAWKMRPSLKFAWAVFLSLFLILITYVFWENLGLFFDFFVPLVLLGGHALVAQIIEWRDEAHSSHAA